MYFRGEIYWETIPEMTDIGKIIETSRRNRTTKTVILAVSWMTLKQVLNILDIILRCVNAEDVRYHASAHLFYHLWVQACSGPFKKLQHKN